MLNNKIPVSTRITTNKCLGSEVKATRKSGFLYGVKTKVSCGEYVSMKVCLSASLSVTYV